MKTLHLHNLRPCVIVACFLKKNYCILKLNRSRLSAKKNLIVATEKETYAIDCNNGDVAQMVERSLSIREVRGSMHRIPRAAVKLFRFLQKNYCILKPYSKREMKALHLQIFRLSLIVFRFLQKNYCTSFDKQTYCEKKTHNCRLAKIPTR